MHWKACHNGVMRSAPPWRVMFLGTDSFALNILKALHADLVKKYSPSKANTIVGRLDVVTKKSEGFVSRFVSENTTDMRHHVWPDIDIKPGDFDVGVIASFGHLIPKNLIEHFPHGILNVHPSLLPRWRGCAPIPYTIYAGDQETGVTIQQIQPHKFDIGPILSQNKIAVPPDITSSQLSEIMSKQGAQLIMECLQNLGHHKALEVNQDSRCATYASKINRNDPKLFIDWENDSCKRIDRKFRAFKDMHDLQTYFGEDKVKLKSLAPCQDMWWYTFHDQYLATHPGCAEYIKSKELLGIQCKDGIVGVHNLAMKRPQNAKTFHNGYLSTSEKKYRRFTHKPQLDHEEDTKPRIMSKRRKLKQQRYWHLQMMRLAASDSDR